MKIYLDSLNYLKKLKSSVTLLVYNMFPFTHLNIFNNNSQNEDEPH